MGMMSTNDTIIKLGLECDDANWRHQIDRGLLRNNDIRRRPQKTPSSESRLAPLEDKQLKLISLCGEPVRYGDDVIASASTSAGASEAEEEDVAEATVARTSGSLPSKDAIHDYVVRYQKLPSFT